MKRIFVNPMPWLVLSLIVLLSGTGLIFRLRAVEVFPQIPWNVTSSRLISYFILGGTGMIALAILPPFWLERYAKPGVLAIFAGSLLALFVSPQHEGRDIYVCYLANLYPAAVALLLYCGRNRGKKGLLLTLFGTLGLLIFCELGGSRSGGLTTAAVATVIWLSAAWQDWFKLGRKKTMWLLGIPGVVLLLAVLICSFCRYSLYLTLHAEDFAQAEGYLTMLIRSVLSCANIWGPGDSLPAQDLYELSIRQNTELMTSMIYLWGWGPFFLLVLGTVVLLVVMVVHCRKAQAAERLMGTAIVTAMTVQMTLCLMWSLGFNVLRDYFPLVQGQMDLVIRLSLLGLIIRLSEKKDHPCAEVQNANSIVEI